MGHVVSCHKCGATWTGHGPDAVGCSDGDMSTKCSVVLMPFRRAPGTRGRSGLGGWPRRRIIVRILFTIVHVLRPARQG